MIIRLYKLINLLMHAKLIPYLFRGILPSFDHIHLKRLGQFDIILDVGANKGQFVTLLQYLNPKAKIYCFEPLQIELNKIRRIFNNNPNIITYNLALSNTNKKSQFFITSRRDNSSLIKPEKQLIFFPNLKILKQETVKCMRLDALKDIELESEKRCLLKIDVQGSELQVLEGIGKSFKYIDYIYIELTFEEMYSSQNLISDIISFLNDKRFKLIKINNLVSVSGVQIQGDFLFEKK